MIHFDTAPIFFGKQLSCPTAANVLKELILHTLLRIRIKKKLNGDSLKDGIRQKQKTRSLKKPRVNVVGFQACSKTRYADNTQKADRNRAWVPAQPSEGLHAENSIANEKIRRDGFMKPKAA